MAHAVTHGRVQRLAGMPETLNSFGQRTKEARIPPDEELAQRTVDQGDVLLGAEDRITPRDARKERMRESRRKSDDHQ